jgi:alkylresorcinol/alkylpyrone synthase
MYINSIATSTPETFIDQETVKDLAKSLFENTELDIEKYLPIFENTHITRRPILMPIEYYSKDKTFVEKNNLFYETALQLSKQAIQAVLAKSNIEASEIGIFILVTSSGFVTPTLDAALIDIIGLPTDCIRVPLTGLGCAGGAYSIARGREFAQIYPEKKILILTVETCSLTFRPSDKRKANLVALSLFSDGASAMIVSGQKVENSIRVLSSKSRKWRNSLNVMGWEVADDGLQVIFDKSIPLLIQRNFRAFYDLFIQEVKLDHKTIEHFLFHPGGMKVIEAFSESLQIDIEKFQYSYSVLKNFGNLSSPTIFFVINEFLNEKKFHPNEKGIFCAMGPGFSCELSHFETT